MKKRLVSIIVVMVMLATLLTGCNLITLNEERDGSQVVSTVDVDGLTGIVTKSELVGTFNQIGYIYLQYGMKPDEIIDKLSQQLSEKEILVLYATKAIAEAKGVSLDTVKTATTKYIENERVKGTSKYDNTIRPYDLFELFDADEQMYVIKQANKSLEDSYNTILQQVKDDEAANKHEEDKDENDKDEETEEEKEEKLEPRKPMPLSPVTEFEKDASIVDKVTADKDFDYSFFKKMSDKATKGELSDTEKKAYNQFEKNLNKAYDTVTVAWHVILDGQKELRLINKYKDEFVTNSELHPELLATDEEILSRYTFTINSDLQRVKDAATYKTAYEADQTNNLLVHSNKDKGYFTVKSILLKFNKEQESALEAIKKGIVADTDNKVAYVAARDKLATEYDYSVVGVGTGIGGIKVNVSNPYYDPNAVCEDKDCPCINCVNNPNRTTDKDCDVDNCPCVKCPNHAYTEKNVKYTDILDRLSIDLANAKDIKLPAELLTEENASKAAAARLNAKVDVFNDYLYLVNDDPGMFEKAGYAVSSEGASSYVAEYVALARALKDIALEKNTIGVVGGITSNTLPYPFKDKKNEPAVIVHSYVATNEAGEPVGEPINYIVNDFGIHIVMVTYVPHEDETLTTKVAGKDNLYILGKEYMTTYKNVYVTDDKGKVVLVDNGEGKMVKQLKKLENKTVYDKLKEQIEDKKKSDTYDEAEKKLVDSYKGKIVNNDKMIKAITNEILDALKAQGYDPNHTHDHNHNH